MQLQEKYLPLITMAKAERVGDLEVREQDGVLYLDGTVRSGADKDNLWNKYATIDPTYSAGDLVMNIKVSPEAIVTQAKVTTESSNLNIRKGPGTDQPIVGKAEHGETVQVVSRSNDQWWLIRSVDGEEGYAYARYLEALG